MKRRLLAILGAMLLAALLTACGNHETQQQPPAQEPASSEATPPATTTDTSTSSTSTAAAGTPCPSPPPCKAGQDCSNYPFVPTDCWTTQYGPAKADVIIPKPGTKTAVTSPNMLYCDGNTYALCFFSGPPTATGKKSTNNPLPCVMNGDVANCTCQAYTSGPNFVDINGILNRGAYFETVDLCGQDGGRCKTIEHCWPPGDPKKQAECQKRPEAPVCKYVKNQGSGDPHGWLMPKADLISTFSFAMSGKDGGYQLGSTACTGQYAGCMTAPCSYGPNHTSPTTDGELVQCQCPTHTGEYQIGQTLSPQSCSITGGGASYTWSASNTVPVETHIVKEEKK